MASLQQRTLCHGRGREKRWWSVRSERVLEFLAEDAVWYTVNTDADDDERKVLSVDPDGGPNVRVGQHVTLKDGGATYRILAIASITKVNVRSNTGDDDDEYDLQVLCDVEPVNG